MYVKITVANLGVNPGYVKIYCHKNGVLKGIVKPSINTSKGLSQDYRKTRNV